jgi:hypothetical protein
MSRVVPPALMERLGDLALVEIDVLLAGVDDGAARAVVAAYVADLEAALGEARVLLREWHRELGVGADPLGLLDVPAERRAGSESAASEAAARLGARAAARRELARLEEAVRGVLPRLAEGDRRLQAM